MPHRESNFMRLFMFRCPRTGHVVKGQADDPRLGEPAHTYHPVQCSACGGSHLVDPTTGETWSDGIEGLLDEEEDPPGDGRCCQSSNTSGRFGSE